MFKNYVSILSIAFGSVFYAGQALADNTTVEMLNKRDDGAKMAYSEDITRIDVGIQVIVSPTSMRVISSL